MLCIVALALAGAAPPAFAAGAWTTWLRTYTYSDLLAEGDTVWCATGEAGLLRFDRAAGTFTSFTRAPGGLASNALTVLAQDRSRRLWVGTPGLGVSRLSASRTSWDLVNRFDGLPTDSVTALTAVGDTLWIGTSGGLALWNGRAVAGALPDGVHPSPFASNFVVGIVQHGDSLWVGTQAGIYVGQLSTGFPNWTLVNDGLGPNLVWKKLRSEGTALFGMTDIGTIYRRDFGAGPWQPVSFGIGSPSRIDASGPDLFTSTSNGIFRWNGAGWTLVNGALVSPAGDPTGKSTFAVASDEAHRVAAANISGLAAEPSGGGTWPVYVPPGPPGNSIQNLVVDGPRIYVATDVEGIGRFDGANWRLWPPVPCSGGCDTTFLTPVYSYALQIDGRGVKWFAMWQRAIEELHDDEETPQVVHHRYPFPDIETNAWGSAADSVHGGVWFGMETWCLGCPDWTPIGLYYFNHQGQDSLNLRPDSIPNMRGDRIRAVTVDHLGMIWVGYPGGGLQRFTWPALQFQDVPGTDNLDVQGLVARGDSIWALTTRDVRIYNKFTMEFADSFLIPNVLANHPLHPLDVGLDRTAYVGSTLGLRVRHPNGSYQDFTTANSPIAGNAVQAVQVDRATGVVWIGTETGLSRYDPGWVAPPPPPIPSLDVTLYPNPLYMTALGVQLSIQGSGATYQGRVLDLSGREVNRFSGVGNRQVIWNGRNSNGDLVRPGIYFIRTEAGGHVATQRVVVLR